MDNARKKLRVCLICVVMAAVVIGLIYYFNDMKSRGKINEGTLVENRGSDWHDSDYMTWDTCKSGLQESRG